MSGINRDGTLKKYPTPQPKSPLAIAAATNDLATLSSSELKPYLWEIDEFGNTPLIWAADRGNLEALKYILSQYERSVHGINTRGFLGNTALSRASRGGHCSCVKFLLEQRGGGLVINPNICNEKLQYPLHYAAFKQHAEVVKALLDSGLCNTLVRDRKGRTPAEDTSVEEIRNMILEYRAETL